MPKRSAANADLVASEPAKATLIPLAPLCVDVSTASAAIGLSKSSLRQLINTGELPTVRFPGRYENERSRRVLIRVSDLEAFVAKHRDAR